MADSVVSLGVTGASTTFGLGLHPDAAKQITITARKTTNRRNNSRTEFSGKRVLVIEDDRSQSMFLTRQLQRRGFHTVAALNGADAAKLLVRPEHLPKDVLAYPSRLPAGTELPQRFDLVTCDYTLPGLLGPEVMELMRSHGVQRDLPVLGLTANVIEQDLTRFRSSGVDRVCHKADATKKSQIDVVLDFARESLR